MLFSTALLILIYRAPVGLDAIEHSLSMNHIDFEFISQNSN